MVTDYMNGDQEIRFELIKQFSCMVHDTGELIDACEEVFKYIKDGVEECHSE